MEGKFDARSSLSAAFLLLLAALFVIGSYRSDSAQVSLVKWHRTPRPLSVSLNFGVLKAEVADDEDHAKEFSRPPLDVHVNVTEKVTVSGIEGVLRRARGALRRAMNSRNSSFRPLGVGPGEYVPVGGIYRNARSFHWSYKEMERRFKVFVYPEGEPPLVHNGPCQNIYTTEGRFIHEIDMDTRFVTKDPAEAHAFFLPFSVVMMVSFIYKPLSYDLTPVKHFIGDYIDVVSKKYPFWNRSLGADHFMLSCHDWGPLASHANENLYSKSIRVLCNANSSEGFDPKKDASLPEMNILTPHVEKLIGGPSALRRQTLAFFAGGSHGPVRPILFKHWLNKTEEGMDVHEYLPKGVDYHEKMKNSKYCLCPSGYEVASPRIVEAIYSECVPVIISDSYVLPFSDVLNWDAFSVSVPLSDIPNLKNILESIPTKKYVQLQKRVKQVQRHFIITHPPQPYDMFHMILHSVWLRRLNVQIP